jgi:hypothetical protein
LYYFALWNLFCARLLTHFTNFRKRTETKHLEEIKIAFKFISLQLSRYYDIMSVLRSKSYNQNDQTLVIHLLVLRSSTEAPRTLWQCCQSLLSSRKNPPSWFYFGRELLFFENFNNFGLKIVKCQKLESWRDTAAFVLTRSQSAKVGYHATSQVLLQVLKHCTDSSHFFAKIC